MHAYPLLSPISMPCKPKCGTVALIGVPKEYFTQEDIHSFLLSILLLYLAITCTKLQRSGEDKEEWVEMGTLGEVFVMCSGLMNFLWKTFLHSLGGGRQLWVHDGKDIVNRRKLHHSINIIFQCSSSCDRWNPMETVI